MKRGKNNKARLGANLLRKVRDAKAVIVASIPKPFRASGKSMPEIRHLVMLNNMRCYVLKTKVKNLDPKVIKALLNIIKLIMTNYAYSENVYHEEPTIEHALIPEEHKEKLNDQTNSTENA